VFRRCCAASKSAMASLCIACTCRMSSTSGMPSPCSAGSDTATR
jgi:hypothetical protein